MVLIHTAVMLVLFKMQLKIPKWRNLNGIQLIPSFMKIIHLGFSNTDVCSSTRGQKNGWIQMQLIGRILKKDLKNSTFDPEVLSQYVQ
jgi:hypothetical protein